jgi:MerR family transcriptional regulator, mercuric resistance operon regulatory protein
MAGLTIGKFAAAEGVGVETVRFYQRRGLLPLPDRQGSGTSLARPAPARPAAPRIRRR